MSFELTIDTANLARAMAQGPQTLERHLSPAIGRTVLEMGRSARRNLRANKSMAFSTLMQSIIGLNTSPLEGVVRAGTDYARMVEEGTEAGGFPPEKTIEDWIKVKGIQPQDPRMDVADLAFVIARAIAVKGTPAKPYMEPAYEDNRDRAERRIDRAINAALKEMAS